VGFGFFAGYGILTGILGILELIIGLIYLLGMPKSLNRSAADLFMDRAAAMLYPAGLKA
jgi:hypothetical protein